MEEVVCPPGDQAYVPAAVDGVAVNVAEEPEHMVTPAAVTAGSGFTVTVVLVNVAQLFSV